MNDWFNYLIIKNASIFLQRINFFENSFETNKLKHETGTKRSLKKEREWNDVMNGHCNPSTPVYTLLEF